MIKESIQDAKTGCICISWTGTQPSDAEFLEHALKFWQVNGELIDITPPAHWPIGSAVIQPVSSI